MNNFFSEDSNNGVKYHEMTLPPQSMLTIVPTPTLKLSSATPLPSRQNYSHDATITERRFKYLNLCIAPTEILLSRHREKNYASVIFNWHIEPYDTTPEQKEYSFVRGNACIILSPVPLTRSQWPHNQSVETKT